MLACFDLADNEIQPGMKFAGGKPYVFPTAIGHLPRPMTKVSVAPNWARAKGTNAATVGLILLDSSLKPVYCNSEALRLFAYPNQPPPAPNAEFLESILSIVGKKPGTNDFPITTYFVSGKRRYLCRTFVLESEADSGSKPAIALTVERERWALPALAARFQLTGREIEAVQHLAGGLTSKEIAQRMNISPNTVKTFLRLIMLKMSVTTRSGVIGKLISGAPFGDE